MTAITLTINGQRREFDGPIPLTDFLSSIGVNLKFVAVAYNGEVIDRDRFPQVTLGDGDHLEVVRPVGGG